MKRLLITLVFVVLTIAMNAQNVKVLSRIELKGGKTDVIGYAEPQADGGYVVETEGGDVFYYSASEVKKVSVIAPKEEKVKVKKPLPDVSSDRSKSRGYMGIVEGNMGTLMGVSLINGYRFSQHFYMGLGLGLGYSMEDCCDIPFYLHLRTEFTKRRVSPYLALNVGVVYEEYEGSSDDGYGNGYSSTNSYVAPYLEASVGVRSYCKRHGIMWYGVAGGFVPSWYIPVIALKIAYSF